MLAAFGVFLSGDALVIAATLLFYLLVLSIPFVVWALYRHWWGFAAWLIPALWSGNIMMELPLASLMVLLAIRFRHPATSALMFFARLDTAPLALMLTRWRAWWQLGLMVLPWAIINLWLFGPTIDSLANVSRGYSALDIIGLIGNQYGAGLVAIGIVGCLRKHWYLVVQLGLNVALDAYRDAPFAWHYVVVPAIIVLGLRECQLWITSRAMLIPATAAFVGAVLVSAVLIYGQVRHTFVYDWQAAMRQSISVPGTLGAYNSGIVGFYNGQKVYNLDGVFAHEVIEPDFIADFPQYVGAGYDHLVTLSETSNGPYGLYVRQDLGTNR